MTSNYCKKKDRSEVVEVELHGSGDGAVLIIATSEDDYRQAEIGDWIVKDRHGTRVFSADEFAALYEPVGDEIAGVREVVMSPQAGPNLRDITMHASAVVVGAGEATGTFDNLARASSAPVERWPKLRRIRVEIERSSGRVFTTVLTTAGRGQLIVNGGNLTLDAADTDADRLIVLTPREARKWLKRLKKRGIQ